MRYSFHSVLRTALLAATAGGLYVSWVADDRIWYVFAGAIFALVMVWQARQLSTNEPLRLHPILIPLTAVPLWGLLQIACGWTVYQSATQLDLLRWAVYLAVTFLALQLWGAAEHQEAFVWWTMTFAFGLTLFALLHFYSGTRHMLWNFRETEESKLFPFLNRDHYATFIALVIPMALAEAIGGARMRIYPTLVSAVLYASVIAGQSRAGSVVITALILGFFLLVRLRRNVQGPQVARAALALAALAATCILTVGSAPLLERFSPKSDLYHNVREELIRGSLVLFRERPWTGFGLGTWTAVYPGVALSDSGVFVNAAHSDWAQWSDEGGVFVLASMLLLFGLAVRIAMRVPWALGLVAVLVHCLVEFPLQIRFLAVAFYLVLGIAAAAASSRQPQA